MAQEIKEQTKEELLKENAILRNKLEEIARIANSISKKHSMVSIEELEKWHINLEVNPNGTIKAAYLGPKKEKKPRAPRKPKEATEENKEAKEEKK